MKAICLITFVLALRLGAFGQAAPVEKQINDLWRERRHAELQALLDAKASATPPDLVALYCCKFFYIFVLPDQKKALQSATNLKMVADASHNKDFIELATQNLADVKSVPAIEFVAPEAIGLDTLYKEFPDKFPNIDFAVRLRQFIGP